MRPRRRALEIRWRSDLTQKAADLQVVQDMLETENLSQREGGQEGRRRGPQPQVRWGPETRATRPRSAGIFLRCRL